MVDAEIDICKIFWRAPWGIVQSWSEVGVLEGTETDRQNI